MRNSTDGQRTDLQCATRRLVRRSRLALARFVRFLLVVSVLFSLSLFVRMARNPVALESEYGGLTDATDFRGSVGDDCNCGRGLRGNARILQEQKRRNNSLAASCSPVFAVAVAESLFPRNPPPQFASHPLIRVHPRRC